MLHLAHRRRRWPVKNVVVLNRIALRGKRCSEQCRQCDNKQLNSAGGKHLCHVLLRICNHFTATEAGAENKILRSFLLLSGEFPFLGRTLRRLASRAGKPVLKLLKSHPLALEPDPLGLQPETLLQCRFATQGDAASGTQNPLPGQSAHQAQDPGDLAGATRISSGFGDRPVGAHASPGYLSDGGSHCRNHGLLVGG
jgi:hypothetical protein